MFGKNHTSKADLFEEVRIFDRRAVLELEKIRPSQKNLIHYINFNLLPASLNSISFLNLNNNKPAWNFKINHGVCRSQFDQSLSTVPIPSRYAKVDQCTVLQAPPKIIFYEFNFY